MVIVRARLDDAADERAGNVAELGGVVVRLDADLRERVRTRLIRQQVIDRLVHIDAVEHVVVLLFALPVHVRPSRAEILRFGEAVRVRRRHAGHQQGELREVATVERQASDGRFRNHFSDDRVLSLQDR